MALDATVGGPNSNSYATVAQADTVLTEERLHTDQWTLLVPTTATKEAALISATYYLDRFFEWFGTSTTEEQALRHPRSGLVDRDGWTIEDDELAPDLVAATIDYAYALLVYDRITEPKAIGLGVSEGKLDVLTAKIDPSMVYPLVPDSVRAVLAFYGELIPLVDRGAKSAIVRVRRA